MKFALTPFEKEVLSVIRQIPRGRVSTYKAVAKASGRPKAARAVGNALNNNPHPVTVPCHRVVKSDGRLGGYAGGTDVKVKLLKRENVLVDKGKIAHFQALRFDKFSKKS